MYICIVTVVGTQEEEPGKLCILHLTVDCRLYHHPFHMSVIVQVERTIPVFFRIRQPEFTKLLR